MKWIKTTEQQPPFEKMVLVTADWFDPDEKYSWAKLIESTTGDAPEWHLYRNGLVEMPIWKINDWIEITPPGFKCELRTVAGTLIKSGFSTKEEAQKYASENNISMYFIDAPSVIFDAPRWIPEEKEKILTEGTERYLFLEEVRKIKKNVLNLKRKVDAKYPADPQITHSFSNFHNYAQTSVFFARKAFEDFVEEQGSLFETSKYLRESIMRISERLEIQKKS